MSKLRPRFNDQLLWWYVDTRTRMKRLTTNEAGVETVEVIAMGVVMVVLLGMIMQVFQSRGQQVGGGIIDGLMDWIDRLGG